MLFHNMLIVCVNAGALIDYGLRSQYADFVYLYNS